MNGTPAPPVGPGSRWRSTGLPEYTRSDSALVAVGSGPGFFGLGSGGGRVPAGRVARVFSLSALVACGAGCGFFFFAMVTLLLMVGHLGPLM
jgi:hypothetical protein